MNLPYTRLLTVSDDEKEFLTLEELKPHHLTELDLSKEEQESKGTDSHYIADQQHENILIAQSELEQGYSVYYDLNSQKTSGQTINNLYQDMTIASDTLQIERNMNSMDSSNLHECSSQHEYSQKGSRKRKFSYSEVSDIDEDDAKSVRTDDNKKANHSEIEKRRRDKMNNFISELSAMIPITMSRKLDKLTVLRMAVQHLKTIRGAVHSMYCTDYKPAFLSDQELKALILQAAEGFLFVVGCDRGRILYVSESVSEVLNYSQGELLGQSWFDILHPKDIAKVKEQLSSSDLSPRERLIDAKTMLPVKHSDVPAVTSSFIPGARRSFFCRMKCKSAVQVKEENDSSSTSSNCHRRNKKQMADKKFVTIQSIGYLKSWAPAKIGLETSEQESESEDCLSLSCLVAVGRLIDYNNDGFCKPNNSNNNSSRGNPSLRNVQFVSRHGNDGKFLFVDQRATLVLGFLPQELLHTSMYEYFNHRDIAALAESHKVALTTSEKVLTPVYGMRTKDNGFINVQSEWKSFRNPWTRDIEFLIAKNNVIFSDLRNYENGNQTRNNDNENNNYDFLNQTNGREMTRMINTHIEASKIGRQIAEQVLDYQRRMGDGSSGSSPDPDPTLSQTIPAVSESQLHASLNVDNNNSSGDQSNRVNGTYSNFSAYSRSSTSLNLENGTSDQTITGDGNDDASMAVLMNLLEADAGLGGPIDFSGLPWPLP